MLFGSVCVFRDVSQKLGIKGRGDIFMRYAEGDKGCVEIWVQLGVGLKRLGDRW